MTQLQTLKIKITHLDLYEPDSAYIEMLAKMKWNDSVKNVQLFQETLCEDTEFIRKYDLVILRHVCYFFRTEVCI